MNELLIVKNDEAVCTSLNVAEKFGKRHDNVMQSISRLLECEESDDLKSKVVKMFKKSTYEDAKGEKRPMYYMNRDGFSLLVMGFNGTNALKWKVQYIEAFDKMEALLAEKSTQLWIETRAQSKLTRKEETNIISQLVEYAKEQGSTHSDKLYTNYSLLAKKTVGISDRDLASVMQLNTLTMVERIILHLIVDGMAIGKNYKEIYKDCKERLELLTDIAYLSDINAIQPLNS